jgi:hypothetical protein
MRFHRAALGAANDHEPGRARFPTRLMAGLAIAGMWTGASRGRMAGFEKRAKRFPTDLADEEWLFIHPLLPTFPKRGRKPTIDLREVLDALGHLARTGGGWRMLPNDFPPWPTVYWWFGRRL